MKAWIAHIVFATLLVGSVSARMKTPDAFFSTAGLEAAVFQIARLHGLVFREYEPIADTGLRALVFDVPDCVKPLRIILRGLDLGEERFTAMALEPDYLERYVYVDQSWDQPRRFAVRVQQIKYEVLATLGQTQYLPVTGLLQLERPLNCRRTEEIDWRMVWNRAYLRD